jgi:hypothetical protein
MGPLASSAGSYSGCRGPGLRRAGTIEFPIAHSGQERTPFTCRDPQNHPIRLPVVAHNDLAIGQSHYLDAVGVGGNTVAVGGTYRSAGLAGA